MDSPILNYVQINCICVFVVLVSDFPICPIISYDVGILQFCVNSTMLFLKINKQ